MQGPPVVFNILVGVPFRLRVLPGVLEELLRERRVAHKELPCIAQHGAPRWWALS